MPKKFENVKIIYEKNGFKNKICKYMPLNKKYAKVCLRKTRAYICLILEKFDLNVKSTKIMLLINQYAKLCPHKLVA